MLRHVVLLAWADGTTAEQTEAVVRELAALPAAIPAIASYWVGADAGLADGNWDLAVVADFADEDDWRTYTDHPVHQRVIAERIRPILARRAAVQTRRPSPATT